MSFPLDTDCICPRVHVGVGSDLAPELPANVDSRVIVRKIGLSTLVVVSDRRWIPDRSGGSAPADGSCNR